MKKSNYFKRNKYLMSFLIILTIYGCNLFTPTISSYDQYAYSQTTALKVDVLNLMDSAVGDYQSQIKAIVIVKTNIEKLYEYEKNLPKNDITLKQWQFMTDTSGHLWSGFLIRWRNEKKLHKAYIDDKKELIGEAFDQIAELESKKIKSPTTK